MTNTTRGFGGPARYFQGPGEINNLKLYTSRFGKNVFAIIDQFFFEKMTKTFKEDFNGSGSNIETSIFNSEVTEKQIEETTLLAKKNNTDVVVGMGGGKTLDTAKAVADNLKCPVVIVPTSASTDAPTIALSVLYTDSGEHLRARHYSKNPDVILIDSQIIADAPPRFLVAGMGDALSTVFEARANALSDSPNYVCASEGGFRRTKTGLAIAEACYSVLIENGLKALMAAESHIVTEALEDIIEVNTLMSGMGVENTACAGAHSVGDGITALPEGKKTLHGEKVAFGVIAELIAENASMDAIDEVMKFAISIGLPITLEDLYVEVTKENLAIIAECSLKSFWSSEPFPVTASMVSDIVHAADAMGRMYRKKYNVPPAYSRR